jgi:predicted dehydrogenase
MTSTEPLATTRVALVGLHGHGRWHLRNLNRPDRPRPVELIGVCDLKAPDDELQSLMGDTPWTDDIDQLLDLGPDITIICTPIQTHLELGQRVVGAGSHLLLEKPTTPTMAGFDRLTASVAEAGVACQVGFQALGSGAIEAIADIMASGEIGDLVGIGGAGVAVRNPEYYRRGPWAGRRRLPSTPGSEPVDVVDGALTNPFVHAVAGALAIAGADDGATVAATEVCLYRANDIEADDTSVIRLVLSGGVTVVVAATTCADRQDDPHLVVHGSSGRIIWPYKTDQLLVESSQRRTEQHDRVDLLDNLVDHLATGQALVAPLAATRGVTAVVDQVRQAPDPSPIPSAYVTDVVVEPAAPSRQVETRPVVAEIGQLVRRAADELATFDELGAPWAGPDRADAVVHLRLDGSPQQDAGGPVVADYRIRPDIEAELAPRPHLHPVRTVEGTVVTDCLPADHRWHLGVGTAIQDVTSEATAPANIWGGRTYIRDVGYLWLGDHGRVRHLGWRMRQPGKVVQNLGWFTSNHRCLMIEDRTITTDRLDEQTWVLRYRSRYHNVTGGPVALGSPGSNGRDGGGYGGFFWRLPTQNQSARVWTATDSGADAVHGRPAPWLAWHAAAADDRPFTLVAAPDDEATAADPWFVRHQGYAGFGSALAWDRPLIIESGQWAQRSVRVAVGDGHQADVQRLNKLMEFG